MGFSPGEFCPLLSIDKPRGDEPPGAMERENVLVHWEYRSRHISLWNCDESVELLRLSIEEARKCVNQLSLIVEMAEGSQWTAEELNLIRNTNRPQVP